jgi:cell division protease FtsH
MNSKNLIKNALIIVLVFLSLSVIFGLIISPVEKPEDVSFGELVRKIEEDKVSEIVVVGQEITAVLKDETKIKVIKEESSSLSELLTSYGLEPEKIKSFDLTVEKPRDFSWTFLFVVGFLPLLIFVFFFLFIFKQAKGGGAMQSLDFTKSRARLFSPEDKTKEKTTFGNVAGLKESKEELQEIVEFLKSPKKFYAMGARIPKGVLLVGPAGVGKTLLARAIAGEAGVPFFHTSGSSFVELFVGTGAARIRDLFNNAKKHAPAIIFIDELDAVGRMRGSGIGGGHDEREQTLNQLLVEMDGFEKTANVIVVSATNRPDVLDSALLRPGRFDRLITLDQPDINDREEILKIHCKDKPLNDDVKLREVAERTPGFSGADLANIANEGAILAARRNQKKINQIDLLESIEKVLLGPERKSHILSKKEKEISAYHEVGHALVSSFLEEVSPVRKISIISRGSAGGYTLKMPKEERKIMTRSEFLSEIAVLLGGYSAEKLKYGEITSGSSNDLEKASRLARKLVKEYGMSSLGPLAFGKKDDLVFLGRDFSEKSNYSEKVAALIDEEVSQIIKEAEEKAVKVLTKNKQLLNKVTNVLIEKETIEKEEFEELIKSK